MPDVARFITHPVEGLHEFRLIDIAGGAAYVVGQDPARCEFSISAVCEFGGLGLATMLLSALIDTASELNGAGS